MAMISDLNITLAKQLSNKEEFLKHLEHDLVKNQHLEEEATKRLKELEDTVNHIKELGKQAEHTAMIPMGKNIYVPGKIIHTGEYLVHRRAHPHSYSMLLTLEQTVNNLERRINGEKGTLRKIDVCKKQISDRINLLLGNITINDELEEVIEVTDDMPDQIKSDKGVAIKVGGFYEIIEFES